jgi:uncharacterized protein involved in exopolysaccharide biosynthesis
VPPMNANAPNDGYFQSETIQQIFAALRRQARVLAVCFLALSAGILGAFIATPPLYDGNLKILVKRDRADSLVSGSADTAANRNYYRELTETEVMSQVELLRSAELLEKVAEETGLAKRVRAERPSLTSVDALDTAAKSLRERLDISPVKRTWLIDVNYEADDRRFTRHVLDTLARLYLEKHLELQRPAGTYQFFADQAVRAKQDLEDIRGRLAEFSLRHQVISASLEKAAVLEKLNDFDALRQQASAMLAESTRRLDTVSADLASVPQSRTAAVKTDTTAVNEVKTRILNLEMQRTQMLQKFTPTYRGVLEIDGQLRDAHAALAAAERMPAREETVADNPTRQWLDTEAARTRADQAAMQARVRSLSGAVAQYRSKAVELELRDYEQQDLTREMKAAETKYLLYAQKREEARISDELDRTRIANVVVAEGPFVANRPEREPGLAYLPLLLGVALMLSGGVALTVDGMTPAYRRRKAERSDRVSIIVPVTPSEQPIA